MEPKHFYRRMEALFEGIGEGIGSATHPERRAEALAARTLAILGEAMALRTVQVYRRDEGTLRLVRSCGELRPDIGAEIAPRIDGSEWPWFGLASAGRIAVLTLGDGDQVLLAFLLDTAPGDRAGASGPPAVDPLLSAFQYALTQHTRHRELEDAVAQARSIQMSLLPPAHPVFADFDIAAVSIPARSVGGDAYDFIQLDVETLAVAVADASGHGLPAALQARDVVTGLRMGLERDVRLVRTVEKLNRVIHRAGLVTRFVSLFVAEIETNGSLTYVNAGHPAPVLLDASGLHKLGIGGMILGPRADATYRLGFAHLDRGASLVLMSDGVLERGVTDAAGFGEEGLVRWLETWREGPAAEAIADLVERLRGHAPGKAFDDDVTAVLIRRPR